MRESRHTWMLGVGVMALVLATAPAGAETVEEVIAKNVAARGGADAWSRVKTIRMSGQFTAFSKIAPFTLTRARDRNYHLDHALNEHSVVIGYDGQTPWWDNHFIGPGPKPIEGADLAVLTRDADFVTPLFDWQERGFAVKLLDEAEFEGEPAIGIELTRVDESKETWYLDPDTYLELARTSPGSDFGRPMEQRTIFDDWRDVRGLQIPHLVESQWYTRDRIMSVESVELNPEIDSAMFAMPPPLGMGPFIPMIGSCDVKVGQSFQPGMAMRDSERTSTIEPLWRGALLREQYTTPRGVEVVRTLSYDRFRELYRFTEIENQSAMLDVQAGAFDEAAGKLSVDNIETGTTTESRGQVYHARSSYSAIGADGFTFEQELSTDGGETWWVALRETYTHQESPEVAPAVASGD